jgi:glycosyltransferase involved in cell wall biosynthesis
MNVLSLSNSPLTKEQGSGYVVMNFAEGLRDRGHEVDAFGPADFDPLPGLRGKLKRYRLTMGIAYKALEQVSRKKYDLIEIYGAEGWLAVNLLSKPAKKPLIVSHSNGIEPHVTAVMKELGKGTASHSGWYKNFIASAERSYFDRSHALVTVSEYDRDYALKQHFQKPSRIVAINNALPDAYLGQKIDLNRSRVVGFCGSWIARKGSDLIKSDIAKVLNRFPDSIFKLVGVGPNFVKEEHFPAEICDRIEIIPFVSDKEALRQIYQSISILIMPSLYESFGLVAAEAMSSGCALVSAKTGFAYELTDLREAVILAQPVSPKLEEAVSMLLTNDSLRRKIAKAGYERVQHLRWDASIDTLERNYQNWLKNPM